MLMIVMSTLTRSSPAKINLTLRVAGRRPDGYHEIESLVVHVNLCDTVTVSLRDDDQWTLNCAEPGIPGDERNLALQAARRLAATAGIERGVHIEIEKRIPAGAGLGGGSSNAATTLMLLNELWKLRLGRTELVRIGMEIGSDVPLFFFGPVCVIRGRGECVEEIQRPLSANLLLFLPELSCPTPAVYHAWDRLGISTPRPSLPEILARLDSPDQLATLLYNDLEEAAFTVNPDLRLLAEKLRRCCSAPLWMTGSGSTLFCLGDGKDKHPLEVEQCIHRLHYPVRTVLLAITPPRSSPFPADCSSPAADKA